MSPKCPGSTCNLWVNGTLTVIPGKWALLGQLEPLNLQNPNLQGRVYNTPMGHGMRVNGATPVSTPLFLDPCIIFVGDRVPYKSG